LAISIFFMVIIASVDEIEQPPGRDLPRKAPAVPAPATGGFLSTIAHNGVPIAVGLFLAIGLDHETDRLIRLVVGPTVQAYEALAEQGELDRQFRTLPNTRYRRYMARTDMAIGKGSGVKLRRLTRFPLIEPQACYKLGHLHLLSETRAVDWLREKHRAVRTIETVGTDGDNILTVEFHGIKRLCVPRAVFAACAHGPLPPRLPV
jgi:hypothetical protein